MCLPSHTSPHLNLSITYKRSVEFQMEIKNNLPSRFRFADGANCVDFTLLFCIGRLRNVKSFKTHVLSYFSAN